MSESDAGSAQEETRVNRGSWQRFRHLFREHQNAVHSPSDLERARELKVVRFDEDPGACEVVEREGFEQLGPMDSSMESVGSLPHELSSYLRGSIYVGMIFRGCLTGVMYVRVDESERSSSWHTFVIDDAANGGEEAGAKTPRCYCKE
jgi:hypothetical protein